MKTIKIILFTFFVFIAFNSFAISDSLLLRCFSQGRANNCASIALMKASMLKYGYKYIFEFEKTGNTGNIYKIRLKDNTRLTITEQERQLAIKHARFNILTGSAEFELEKEEVLFYVYLTYAVIAKFIEKNGYWGCVNEGGSESYHYTRIKSYSEALRFISRTSYCTDNAYRLLGLKIKGKIEDYKDPKMKFEKGTLLYSDGHAVVAYGAELDCYGTWEKAAAEACDNYFEWYYILK